MRPPPLRAARPLCFSLFLALSLFTTLAQCRKPPPRRVADFPAGSPARVLHIVDGDTAYFTLDRGGWVKGRIAGINAPECHKRKVKMPIGRASSRCTRDDEHFGLRSYKVLLKLVRRGSIKLDCQRKRDGRCRADTHGRVLINIQVGGADVAEEMVRSGAALTFTKYSSPKRAALCRAENLAQRNRAGLWAAGRVKEVLAMFSAKTRRWYADHDRRCRRALKRDARP